MLLRDAGDARIIAGGQSLLRSWPSGSPSPSLLVDIGKIPDLAESASTRMASSRTAGPVVGISSEVPISRAHNPLLSEAVGHIAHYQVRNRGTVGGSMLC